MAILVTARQWGRPTSGMRTGRLPKEGLRPEIADAIADRAATDRHVCRRSCGLRLRYRVAPEQCVSDATYARALALFGEKGVIDLTAVNGYYSMIAMVLNVARPSCRRRQARRAAIPEIIAQARSRAGPTPPKKLKTNAGRHQCFRIPGFCFRLPGGRYPTLGGASPPTGRSPVHPDLDHRRQRQRQELSWRIASRRPGARSA